MKKNILILMLLLPAICASADTITNGIKISNMNRASYPLAGTELVPLVQGGSTFAAPVAWFTASLATQLTNALVNFQTNLANNAAATTNFYQVNSNLTWNVRTNTLAIVTNLNTAQSAALAGTNAALAAAIATETAARIVAGTNALAIVTNLNTAQSAALAGTNAALSASLANCITNGGNARLATLTTTNVLTPANSTYYVNLNGNVTLPVDCSAGSYQVVYVTNVAASYYLYLQPYNTTNGCNVSFAVIPPVSAGIFYVNFQTTNAAVNLIKPYATTFYTPGPSYGSANMAFAQIQCFQTNLVCTGGHP